MDLVEVMDLVELVVKELVELVVEVVLLASKAKRPRFGLCFRHVAQVVPVVDWKTFLAMDWNDWNDEREDPRSGLEVKAASTRESGFAKHQISIVFLLK